MLYYNTPQNTGQEPILLSLNEVISDSTPFSSKVKVGTAGC